MPDNGGRSKRGQIWRLSDAHDVGQLIRINCQHCNIKRHYRPADLRRLVGDVACDNAMKGMRCEKCGKADYLVAFAWNPTARELAGLSIRRLADIRMVRKVVWNDEPPR